nr:MAG TPA: hypothetical protein [Caudoviricetes sp.]
MHEIFVIILIYSKNRSIPHTKLSFSTLFPFNFYF